MEMSMKKEEVQKICSVCSTSIKEKYCQRCGQYLSEKPTTIFSLGYDFVYNGLSLEKSVLATMVKTITNPKMIVQNYFDGYRGYYSSPGKVLLYGIAVLALHISFVDRKVMGLTLEAQSISAPYLFWLSLFPLFLIISYLVFLRIEKRLSRHLISITYVASSLLIPLLILSDLIQFIVGELLGVWPFIIFTFLVFLWNSRTFSQKSRVFWILLNTLLQFILFIGILAFMIFLTS